MPRPMALVFRNDKRLTPLSSRGRSITTEEGEREEPPPGTPHSPRR